MKTGYKVCDAMTKEPIYVSPEHTMQECAQIMRDEHVSALLVKNKQELVGIVSEKDIVRKSVIFNETPAERQAVDVMRTKIPTISPEKDIFEALVMMRNLNIRHLPVMDGSHMIGLLTLKDILKIEPQLFDLLVEKFELREEERKPIHNQNYKEGLCQECGKYGDELVEQDGTMVCANCQRIHLSQTL